MGGVTAIASRERLVIPLAGLAAVLFGALVGTAPQLAAGLVGGVLLVAMAFLAPVAHLTLLLIVTAVVPFEVMNAYAIGGGVDRPGLTVSDVLLFSGLLRAALVLASRPLDRWQRGLLIAVLGLMTLVTIQFAHGFVSGNPLNEAGTEARTLMSLGTFVIALPLVLEPARHRALLQGVIVWGLILGANGLAQWFLGASFSDESSGNFGVREGVSLTTGGTGQLQAGLFSYPVAVILAFAVLLTPRSRIPGVRLALVGMLAMNIVCLLVTFERTFWVVTVLGCAFVALRADRVQRARLIVAAPVVLSVALAGLAIAAPATFRTAQERLLSIGQYGSDGSVSYRVRESQFVMREIRERPLQGSGLGASIYWGRPAEGVPAQEWVYTHNGYLWIAWKLGVIGAVLLFGLFAIAAARPGRARADPALGLLALGAQAAILALLIANVTFPSVNALTSTPTVGVLLALAALPRRRSEA
jgi:O-antigen ligase